MLGISTGSNRVSSAGLIAPTGQQRTATVFNTSIAAGAQIPVMQPGSSFYFIVATAGIRVQAILNGGTPGLANTYSQGTGQEMPPGSEFSSLLVTNTTAQPQVISMFIGFGGFIDNRLIAAGNQIQQIVYPTAPLPTATTISINDLSGQAITDINGKTFLAINRVAILMTNFASNTDYLIQAAGSIVNNGPAILAVLARTSLQIPANGNFNINNGGAAINAVVSEVYAAIAPGTLQ